MRVWVGARVRAFVCARVSDTVDLKDSAVANKIRQPVSEKKKKMGATFFLGKDKEAGAERGVRSSSQPEDVEPSSRSTLSCPSFLNPAEVVRPIEAGASCFIFFFFHTRAPRNCCSMILFFLCLKILSLAVLPEQQ